MAKAGKDGPKTAGRAGMTAVEVSKTSQSWREMNVNKVCLAVYRLMHAGWKPCARRTKDAY